MARVHVFADESGDLDCPGQSNRFVLATVATEDCEEAGKALGRLRLDLAWEGYDHPGPFHAADDHPTVRQRVLELMAEMDLRIDATLLEKAKAQPQLRQTRERLYQHAWYYHMKYVAPRIANANDELLVVAASIGTKKKKRAFFKGVVDVMQQVSPTTDCRTACWSASADPCLQIADYAAWSVGRRWETGDAEPYSVIERRVRSMFDLFQRGTTRYY